MANTQYIRTIWKAIRPMNLLIIWATFYAMYYLCNALVAKNASCEYMGNPFKGYHLLALSTVLLAAAGNFWNDLKDKEVDEINRKGTNLTASISSNSAIIVCLLLTILGLTAGYISAIEQGHFLLVVYPVLVAIALWLYTAYFQNKPLIGNIIIALLCASIPVATYVYFWTSFHMEFAISASKSLIGMTLVNRGLTMLESQVYLGFYALSAFFLTLIRELVKDVEDMAGDMAHGAVTFPIMFQLKGTKVLLVLLSTAYLAICFFALYFSWDVVTDIKYIEWIIILAFVIPALFVLRLSTSLKKESASMFSFFLKITMALGIATTAFFWFL